MGHDFWMSWARWLVLAAILAAGLAEAREGHGMKPRDAASESREPALTHRGLEQNGKH